MKTALLSAALLALLSTSACARDAADTTATPSATAMDAGDADAAATSGMGTNPMVGGAAMYETKDIIDNAVNSADHTTLVAAVQAAGLVETLKGPGPFTVFAPTNAAFDALPDGTVETLLKPEMKADLAKVLTYHVVSGSVDAASLAAQIAAGGGEATLATVQGEVLTARLGGPGGVTITDANGNTANVTIADVRQSNGVIHVIDTVLLP